MAKKAKRNSIDWKKFFQLVQNGTTNEQIAKKMGIKLNPKSNDPLKPIRAMKSRAKTMGVTINGETVKLKVPKKTAAVKSTKKTTKPVKKYSVVVNGKAHKVAVPEKEQN